MSEKIGTTIKGKRGGKRPGAGRPSGSVEQTTIDAMHAKKEYLNKIRKNASTLFNSQMALAKGVQMLFVIHTDSKGNRRKPELVTDAETISRFLEENEGQDGVMDNGHAEGSKVEDYYFLMTKPPDSRTISDMLDRAFGKPDQNFDITSKGEQLTQAPLIISDVGVVKKQEAVKDASPTEASQPS